MIIQHSCNSCYWFGQCMESDRFIPCREWKETKSEAGNNGDAKRKRHRHHPVLEEKKLLGDPGSHEPDGSGQGMEAGEMV